jgi:hypothetical protein
MLAREEELERAEVERQQDAKSTSETSTVGFFARWQARLSRVWRKFAPREVQFYYDDLMPSERFHFVNVYRPGRDLYLAMFLIELICCIWILACYDL